MCPPPPLGLELLQLTLLFILEIQFCHRMYKHPLPFSREWNLIRFFFFLGLATEFRSEKIPRNRLGTASVIPRKKVLIPRYSKAYWRDYSEARNGRKWHEKYWFYKITCSSKHNWQHDFVRDMLRNGIPSCCLFHGMFRNRIPSDCLYFCSTAWNWELFSLPRNGSKRNSERLPLILFHGTEFRAIFSSAVRFGT